MLFFGFGLFYGMSFLPDLVAKALALIFSSPDGWLYTLLYFPLIILFGVVFVISLSAVIYFCSSVVGAPFNALLAERVLVIRGRVADQKYGVISFLRTSWSMLKVAVVRGLILITLSLILLLVSFVPGLNVVSAFLTLVLLAFDASDYAMEGLHWNLSQRLQFLRQQLPEYFGMATVLAVFFIIPGAIVLMMPVFVVGASDFLAEGRPIDSRSNS